MRFCKIVIPFILAVSVFFCSVPLGGAEATELTFLDGYIRNVNSAGNYSIYNSITPPLPFTFSLVHMNSNASNGASHILLSTGFTLDDNNSLYIFNDENIYSGALDFSFVFQYESWPNYFHPDYLNVSCSLLLGPADPASSLNLSYSLVPDYQMVVGYSYSIDGRSLIYHLSFTLNGPSISDITFDPRYILFDFSWPDFIDTGVWFKFNLLDVVLSFGPSDDPPPVVPGGTIDDITDYIPTPDSPAGSDDVDDYHDMEEALLDSQSDQLSGAGDLISGFDLTFFSDGLLFVGNIFGLFDISGGWIHALLIVSLTLGLIALLLNLGPTLYNKISNKQDKNNSGKSSKGGGG